MRRWQLRQPNSVAEWQQYYQLRWQVLRQPWQQPLGSERDKHEEKAYHLMLINTDGDIAAVGRVHKCAGNMAQIRYMAVAEAHRSKGAGSRILQGLEQQAVLWQCNSIMLNARELAVNFYQDLGYQQLGPADPLFGIAHFQLQKHIRLVASSQQLVNWCQQLSSTWQQTIPLSQFMQLTITSFDGNALNCTAPLAPNINLHQTMFAGSIYTLATLTGWGMVYLQLQAAGLAGDIVLADANIRYLSPISTQPTSRCQLQNCYGDVTRLSKGRKAAQLIKIEVLCADKVAAEFTGRFVVLPKI